MADKQNFVGEFRGSVTAMMNAYNSVLALCQFFYTMDWTENDFVDALAGSDITSADLQAAVDAMLGAAATFAASAEVIAKMHP